MHVCEDSFTITIPILGCYHQCVTSCTMIGYMHTHNCVYSVCVVVQCDLEYCIIFFPTAESSWIPVQKENL